MTDELIKDVRKDYKNCGGDQRFNSFLAVSSGVVYLYSLVRPTPYVLSGTVLDRYDCLQLVELYFPSRNPPKFGRTGKELDDE